MSRRTAYLESPAYRQPAGAHLVALIEEAERVAHRDGFHVSAHALNRAKNALGWEIAGDIEQAGKAALDKRPSR